MARRDSDMTQGSIWRHIVAFSLPMMLGLAFQQLYNTVDSIVVGKYVGKVALAAVGNTGPILSMLVSLFSGMATGSSVIISQHYGAHDYGLLRKSVHTTITFTLITCVIGTAIGLLLVDVMLHMMAMPEDVYPEAREYLVICFAGLSGQFIYNMGSGILRAVGDSRRPLYFLIFSAVLNTVLDFVFVIWLSMGVRGVGFATIISQCVSAVLVMYTLTGEHAPYSINWRELGIHLPTLKSICGIGLPTGVQQTITSFSNIFVQSYINAFGASCMAGYTSYNKLDSFITVPVQAFALGVTTLVGQNWGAGNRERARKGVRIANFMSLGCAALLAAIMMIFARPLLSIFNGDEAVLDYGVRFIMIVTPFYIFLCFNNTFSSALRGIGKAKLPMITMLSCYVGVRQLFLALSKALGAGFTGVALAYPAGWLSGTILLTILYLRSPLCRKEPGLPSV